MNIKELNKLKFKTLSKINGINDTAIDDKLTQQDAHKIYLKIIRLVGSDLDKSGFEKQGTTNFYRIVNNCYQRLNFQKSSYGAKMTVNIAFKNISDADNLDSLKHVLPNMKRLGQLDVGYDKWYPINNDYHKTAADLIDLINNKVIPYFEDKTNSKLKGKLKADGFIQRTNKIY